MSLKWPKIAKNGQIRPKMCKNRFFSKVWTSTHQSKCLNELCRFKRSKNSQINQKQIQICNFLVQFGPQTGQIGGTRGSKSTKNGRKIDFSKSTQNWSPMVKSRFWALWGVGKTQLRPLRASYTHLQLDNIWLQHGKIRPKCVVLAVFRALFGYFCPNTQS